MSRPLRATVNQLPMVGVAQLVEPRIVIPVVVGSSPIIHPILKALSYQSDRAFLLAGVPGRGLR